MASKDHHHFCMPAESFPHQRTLTAWPDRASQANNKDLEGAEKDIAAISNAIVQFEPVTLLCKAQNVARAKKLVSAKVEILELDIDELWIRDTGPVYVKNSQGKLVGLDLNFNYWGKKYQGTVDSAVAASVLDTQGVERFQAPFVSEGGAIEVDGDGTMLVTASSVVNENRNPGQTKEDLARHFHRMLGVENVIWLNGIKDRDITDWHIDAMARFIAPGQVLLSRPPSTFSSSSSDRIVLDCFEEAKAVLAAAKDARGRAIQVLELDEADADLSLFDGEDRYGLVLSYLNYLLVNGGVIIPAFGDTSADHNALNTFRKLFPNRQVEQVHLSTIRRLGGGIHCATQQVPMS